MNASIGVEEFNRLKSEFKSFLRETYPDLKDVSISTIWSDAFFAMNNNVGVDFWASLINEESILATRDKIRDFLVARKEAGNSERRADEYLSTMRKLKEFLDAKHPTLPSEWKGKSISDLNLKSDFQAWMKKQKKSNGESYSANTINVYTTQLKNGTARLGLGTTIFSNLFFYTSYDEFEAAHQAILNAPNFDEIDAAAGNKAYSYGMILYARFLKELGTPSAWIFQGNPKYYDVTGAVEELDHLIWAVNQYPKQIKKGDKAYIWVSGSDSGIIASGTILSNPEIKEPNLSDPYSHGEALKSEPYLAVDIAIERRFILEKVPRSVLLVDERTKKLEILTYPGATNFRVTKAHEEVIESIIEGSYIRVPAVDEPQEEVVSKHRYWLYSPGEKARLWDAFYQDGIMGIGWEDLGDLSQYELKSDIMSVMKQEYGENTSHKNDSLASWQFVHEIAVGDVVFVKRGMSTIVGRGVVESDYIYDESRIEYSQGQLDQERRMETSGSSCNENSDGHNSIYRIC